jgi:drug/metabolite transporter (DMT)-like permease
VNTRTRAELYLLSITLIWGSTFVITKGMLHHVSPFLYTGLRFTGAAILLGFFAWRSVATASRSSIVNGGILGLLLFVGFILQTIGLQYTSASKSAFITGMLVVLTPICQIVIERRPPQLGNLIGIAFVTFGLYFLTSPEGSQFNIGDLLTLGCALCFALYIVYLDIFSQEHSSVQLAFYQSLVSGLLAFLGVFLYEDVVWNPDPQLLGALAYLTVFATLVALFVQVKYQKDTTPTRAAVIFSVEPVFAALMAYLFANEVLGVSGILGGGLIVAGMLISELSDVLPLKRKSPPAP